MDFLKKHIPNAKIDLGEGLLSYHLNLLCIFYFINMSLMYFYHYRTSSDDMSKTTKDIIMVLLVVILALALIRLQYLVKFFGEYLGQGTARTIVIVVAILISVAMLFFIFGTANGETFEQFFKYAGIDEEKKSTLWFSSLWYSVISHSTVGYGDIYAQGIIPRFINVLYILLVFLPTASLLTTSLTGNTEARRVTGITQVGQTAPQSGGRNK